MTDSTIIYTHTDEAPLLATYSFLPIVQAYAARAGVAVDTRDISLAGRILALFPDYLTEEQQIPDALTELGELTADPSANIIKLPNISASVPQLKAAIAELKQSGYALPGYPDDPKTEQERDIRERYDKVKGSAVNPVLRQGNSDRRAPAAVKNYARTHPHRMGTWEKNSKTTVATMTSGDFRHTERSMVIPADDTLRIELTEASGDLTVLRERVQVTQGEIVDTAVMHVADLEKFLADQAKAAKDNDVLFSLHLKATMMKVSDPVIFGHAVRSFFPDTFTRYGTSLAAAGLYAEDGLGSIFGGIDGLPQGKEIRESFKEELQAGPALAMVDSDRGITNLHVPSDVIIDASMPAAVRSSGQMWNSDGEQQDTKFVIPDHSYAPVYAEVVRDCREHGAFDPATMGTTPNVGLMAQQA
ncbi:MAG TPA: NADP-dependent isocitrate dehydrogenase, partial [Streptosporangiaceae bacterium]|nr:NADP-dependent isocitrate dehydrogenase [Streptosporangiaceae bacterium]